VDGVTVVQYQFDYEVTILGGVSHTGRIGLYMFKDCKSSIVGVPANPTRTFATSYIVTTAEVLTISTGSAATDDVSCPILAYGLRDSIDHDWSTNSLITEADGTRLNQLAVLPSYPDPWTIDTVTGTVYFFSDDNLLAGAAKDEALQYSYVHFLGLNGTIYSTEVQITVRYECYKEALTFDFAAMIHEYTLFREDLMSGAGGGSPEAPLLVPVTFDLSTVSAPLVNSNEKCGVRKFTITNQVPSEASFWTFTQADPDGDYTPRITIGTQDINLAMANVVYTDYVFTMKVEHGEEHG